MKPEIYTYGLTGTEDFATQVTFFQNATGCVVMNEGPGKAYVQPDGADQWLGAGSAFTVPAGMGLSYAGAIGQVAIQSESPTTLTVAASEGEQGTRLFSFKQPSNDMRLIYNGTLQPNPDNQMIPGTALMIQPTDPIATLIDFRDFALHIMLYNNDRAVALSAYVSVQGQTADNSLIKDYCAVKNLFTDTDLDAHSLLSFEDTVRANGLFIQVNNRSASTLACKIWLHRKR